MTKCWLKKINPCRFACEATRKGGRTRFRVTKAGRLLNYIEMAAFELKMCRI